MVIGITKSDSIVGVEVEVTEGVFIEPQADTSFVQPIDFAVDGTRETQEREILTSGLAKAKPIPGIKAAEASLTLELRGSGLEGEQTDAHNLLKATFGTNRSLGARVTTKAGNTDTVLQIEDADISSFKVGDAILVLESGAHHIAPIIAVDPTGGFAEITLGIAAEAGSPADNVEIAKFQTYLPSNNQGDYASLSVSNYLGNEIRRSASGLRPNAMTVADFTTGVIPKLEFAMSGTTFNEVDGAAPFTPNYDDASPTLVLGSCAFVDGVKVDINNLTVNFDSPVTFLTATCQVDGRISSRRIPRVVTFSIDPYKDDTTTEFFDKFDANTSFEFFVFLAQPSIVSGEFDLGSIVTFFMPSSTITTQSVSDLEDVLQDTIEATADGGNDGTGTEIFMGFI